MLTHELTAGGTGTHVYELAQGLSKRQHQIYILSLRPYEEAFFLEPNITFCCTPSAADYIAAINRLFEHSAPPDIVHCHNLVCFPLASILCERFPCRLVSTVHGVVRPLADRLGCSAMPKAIKLETRLCLESQRVICVSHAVRHDVRAMYDVESSRLTTIYNGMDIAAFSNWAADTFRHESAKQQYAANGEQVVVFGGRIDIQKGLGFLLEAAVQVCRRMDRVKYLIAGDKSSPYAHAILAAVRRHLSEEKMQFIGKVSRLELASLYAFAQLAVVPSLYEPFGYAAVEAMACGCPVVASDVDGLKEVIENGVTGQLVPMHKATIPWRMDSAELVEAQCLLLNNSRLREQQARAAQSYVRSSFGLEVMSKRVDDVYQEAMQLPPKRIDTAITESLTTGVS